MFAKAQLILYKGSKKQNNRHQLLHIKLLIIQHVCYFSITTYIILSVFRIFV